MPNTPSGIPAATDLRRLSRRLDRRIARVNAAIAAMRDGEKLHLEFRAGAPVWFLSRGGGVSAEVASILINSPLVRPAGGALFSDGPAQVWEIDQ